MTKAIADNRSRRRSLPKHSLGENPGNPLGGNRPTELIVLDGDHHPVESRYFKSPINHLWNKNRPTKLWTGLVRKYTNWLASWKVRPFRDSCPKFDLIHRDVATWDRYLFDPDPSQSMIQTRWLPQLQVDKPHYALDISQFAMERSTIFNR